MIRKNRTAKQALKKRFSLFSLILIFIIIVTITKFSNLIGFRKQSCASSSARKLYLNHLINLSLFRAIKNNYQRKVEEFKRENFVTVMSYFVIVTIQLSTLTSTLFTIDKRKIQNAKWSLPANSIG